MPFRRRKQRNVRRVPKRMSRNKKLIEGRSVLSKAERYVAAGASTAATVAQLARSVGTIFSMINTESKFIDSTGSVQSIPGSPGYVLPTTYISQGDGDSARNGNTVLLRDISIRYSIKFNETATDNNIRIGLICDKEDPRGTPPSVSDVWDITGTTLGPYSGMNMANTKRFVVLKTRLINVNTQHPNSIGHMFVRLPFHLYFTGTGNTVSDADQNHVYFMAFGDNGTNMPTISISTRVRYYDN